MYKDEGNEWLKSKEVKNIKEAHNCYTHAVNFVIKAIEENKRI